MTVLRHPNNQGVTLTQWRYTATGGETTLSGTDGFGASLLYTAGAEQVFVNGVLLERGVDYTASTGNTITGLVALVAGDVATVSSPSSFSVANAIPKATVAAKGDLIVGNGASSVTNLGVGADGTTLVANSSASTGVSWSAGNALGNPVINSGMDIWQRGTSFAVPANVATAYTADRWQAYCFNANSTVSRQATSDTTNLPNIQYCARVQRNLGATNTDQIWLSQNIETANSIPLAGKTVTFSAYIRVGSNYSASSNNVSFLIFNGTGTDQNIVSGYTGSNNIISTAFSATTTWVRYSTTVTIPTNSTEVCVQFRHTGPTGTALASDYFEVTGVQLDLGSVALPYRRSASTLQGELAACQRYYWREGGSSAYYSFAQGNAASTTAATFVVNLPVSMRVPATSVDYSTLAIYDGVSVLSISSASINGGSVKTGLSKIWLDTVVSGATQYRPYTLLTNNSTSGYLGFSAEL